MPVGTILIIIGWILCIVGGLITLVGGLAAYIFRRHQQENDSRFADNRADHVRLHDRIDNLKDGK